MSQDLDALIEDATTEIDWSDLSPKTMRGLLDAITALRAEKAEWERCDLLSAECIGNLNRQCVALSEENERLRNALNTAAGNIVNVRYGLFAGDTKAKASTALEIGRAHV